MVSEHAKAVAFATLVPGAGMAIGYSVWLNKSVGLMDLWKKSKKPSWAIEDEKIICAVDLLTAAASGYGAYLVFKKGGFDHADTKMALLSYAASYIGVPLVSIPLWKSKKWSRVVWSGVLQNVALALTTLQFFKIDEKSGYAQIPVLVWMHLWVMLMSQTEENKK